MQQEPPQENAQAPRFWRAVGEGIAMAFDRSPNFASRFDEAGWLVRGGEKWIDFNCALAYPGPAATAALKRAAEEFRAHGLPFLVCLVEESPELRGLALRLALTCAGPLPLMTFTGSVPPTPEPANLRITFATAPDQFFAVARLSHRCFGLSPEAIGRVMPFDQPANPGLRTLVAYQGQELVASVTYSMQQIGTGIWSMMTAPDLRRQGIARTLMLEAIRRIRADSPKPVFLVSTLDGKPLYDHLGFETIAIGSVWTGQP